MSFASTDLPTLTGDFKKDEAAIRKSILDLLDKINTTTTIQPIPGKVSSDVTYIVNGLGVQTVLIKATSLKASSGGPYRLTITSGTGSDVLVPIAASGDTILSGDLLFDIYIDSSGNVISKAWEISGSNTDGVYSKTSTGDMIQEGLYVTAMDGSGGGTTGVKTVNLPNAFVSTSYNVRITNRKATPLAAFWEYHVPSLSSFTCSGWIRDAVVSSTAVAASWEAVGRWR